MPKNVKNRETFVEGFWPQFYAHEWFMMYSMFPKSQKINELSRFKIWKRIFVDTVSTNKNYAVDTVSTNKNYAVDTVFTYKNSDIDTLITRCTKSTL